ncbi:MAG: putative N-glycosylase-DNA lyase protein [Fusobacteria bacterium]|nr:MAG: putative N-glycosylase-DNA lyase protein [Fusobacteriota bacterium]KAF0228603.1 MAG: putative N-glycosylase-DNA lyase [Fusobacteriota bacterium]
MTDLEAIKNCFNKADFGKTFDSKQIKNIVNIKYGKKIDNIIPSDYCYNITNNGIKNYKNYLHIFINRGTGLYEYVGENYKYTGTVSNKGATVGEWINGIYSSYLDEELSPGNSTNIVTTKNDEYFNTSSNNHGKEATIINLICKYLSDKNIYFDDLSHLENIKARNEGKIFSFSENIRGLVYAQLSNQTKWSKIVSKLKEIDKLFFDYDRVKILNIPDDYFYNGIFKLKCGNIATKKQMISLKDNIHMLELIEKDYGSLDNFYESYSASRIATILSSGKYKLRYIGYALAWEFLRNVGIDGAKPDVHIRRILGRERLAYSNSINAGELESIHIIDELSERTGYTKAFIDAALWSYCSDGYGQVCTADPRCDICLISEYCKYKKNLNT